ncbi:TPA: hypothetical protein N0F65_007944 [Lagenidium giganteum]|uniref:GST N-terminal domain-containing protein n=1 Tax=Lagenidium giganteum TaxID=4803 RepID=A0AAV2YJN5_9STRA|nr:TPA: hypothetical protein N0F65_007944 [Lagenidium giganteum]
MSDLTKIGVALTIGGAIGAGVVALALNPNALKAKQGASTASNELLPKLYIYEHCPFCVRARMIFGLKKVKHDLVFLANHDEATPIGLVGAKQVPILELPNGKAMPESMDIVRYVDTNYGGSVLLKESANREDLKKWIKDTSDVLRRLYHPRFHAALFAEFAQYESREYYRIKKEKTIGSFDDAIAQTPKLVAEANKYLEDLADLLHSNHSVNESLSYDDIDLFGRLRGLTLVKDIKWPPKLREYIDYMSAATDIALLDSMAEF